MSYQEKIRIDAPTERVWAVLVDVERWPEMTASMSRVQRLDEGGFGTGSTVRIEQPRLLPLIWRVAAFEEGRAFTWTARSAGVTVVAGHYVSPSDDGSATNVTLTIRQSGFLAPLVRLLTSKLTRRYLRMESTGLKRVSESGTGCRAEPDTRR
ncbi:SRPBCC family protein (plasmid) [Streptomycetaceae bacterium NBC_01309]